MDFEWYLLELDGMEKGVKREFERSVRRMVDGIVREDGKAFNGWRIIQAMGRLLGKGWQGQGSGEDEGVIREMMDGWIEYPRDVWEMIPHRRERERRLRYLRFQEREGLSYDVHWHGVELFCVVLERLGYRIDGMKCPLWRQIGGRWDIVE